MECDIFVVANNVLIDSSIYELWLEGYSVSEACGWLLSRGVLAIEDLGSWADEECVEVEVTDQYRLFSMIEKDMESPTRLKDGSFLQIPPDTALAMINKYYEFDNDVIREILGKKLSAKTRKELDDVSDKTHVRIKSCRRQFDNFRVIFKFVEEMKGSLVQNIQRHFLLSETLAKRYAASIFITNNRFETNKKKLHYLKFEDFLYCANLMITHWSYSSTESKSEDMDQDIDREFVQDLRHFKVFLDKDHLDAIKTGCSEKVTPEIPKISTTDIEISLKNICRVLINIATDLNHNRDLRDFFVDIVEKLIEPFKAAKWTKTDVTVLLQAIAEVVKDYDPLYTHSPPLHTTWDRYIKVVAPCISCLYRA